MQQEPTTGVVAAALAAFGIASAAMLAIGNAPFPILHDMSEAYVWGREFQLGYNQHPPFWAWVCGGWFTLMPRAGWSFALLDGINAGLGLAGAWALIGDFARGPKRVAALALLVLTPVYTLAAYKYDANTIFLSLWPWTTHAFVRAYRTQRRDWAVGFGLLAGLALMSKYYALILLACCGLGALKTPAFKSYLRSASPWISALVAAIVCAPHLVWLVTHAAPPLRYLAHVSGRDFRAIVGDAAATGVNSLVLFVLAFGVIVVFAWGRIGDGARDFMARWRAEPDMRFLAVLALGPLVITLAAGLALRTKLTPEMPIGTFALIPLLGIEVFAPRDASALARTSTRLAIGLTAAMLALSPVVMIARAALWKHAKDTPPYAEIAAEATRLWREKTGEPLSFVAGRGYENPVVFYGPDRAHTFYDFDFEKNLWVTPARLARLGLTTICLKDDSGCLAATAPFLIPAAVQIPVTVAHRFWPLVGRPFDFVVTLIPPRAP